MEIKSKQQEAQEMLSDFLESELGDYSFVWKIELEDEYEYEDYFYFNVEYNRMKLADCNNGLRFKVKPNRPDVEDEIQIDMGEDSWYEICTFNQTVKYFWMMIKWE